MGFRVRRTVLVRFSGILGFLTYIGSWLKGVQQAMELWSA